MSSKEKQSKVGRSTRLRGQQTGKADTVPAQDRESMKETPALRGRRKRASEMFADESAQHAGADAATPRSNTPSVPAAMPSGRPLGETGGERKAKGKK
ncbi:MAG TPA: hypothetical protein VGX92_18345 [Pyrinomonadaceae bacterium]|jgi:hypothetical protein|nr:hypothetical protein [Pyrinomonadaceae bacterium]